MKKIKRHSFFRLLILFSVLIILVKIALYDGLIVRNYTIKSSKITQSHVLVHLSDLHSTFYGTDQEQLIQKIDRYSPEAVFLTGDIADDVRSIDGCDALMNNLASRYPCYYVTGNHERWSAAADNIKEVFKSYGAVVLDDVSVNVAFGEDTIRIHGVDDPLFYSSYEAFTESVSALSTSDVFFDILLSHRPEAAELYAARGFDLVLSGHAHGGQIRIPLFLNGLYAPNQGWFPSFAGGRYSVMETELIVNRGLMIDDLPRIFNPPELVVITLNPET